MKLKASMGGSGSCKARKKLQGGKTCGQQKQWNSMIDNIGV